MTEEHPIELGYLADIPVMEVGPEEADSIIVADVSQALRLHERRRPDMASSLLCVVQAIDQERARHLIGELNLSIGSRPVDEVAAQLAGSSVEAHINVDFEFESGAAGAAAVRAAPLPPESHDRPALQPVQDPA